MITCDDCCQAWILYCISMGYDGLVLHCLFTPLVPNTFVCCDCSFPFFPHIELHQETPTNTVMLANGEETVPIHHTRLARLKAILLGVLKGGTVVYIIDVALSTLVPVVTFILRSGATGVAGAASTIMSVGRSAMEAVIADLGWTFAGVVVGVVVVLGVGLVAGAAVPSAMSSFGTVVQGVGTIHQAGGVAAMLQWLSHALIGLGAVLKGGLVGGLVAKLVRWIM